MYLDNYEKITKDNVTTEYYFLENDVIVTKKTGTSGSSSIKLYQAVTDNLGSILAVYGETNNLVFKAKYDVWGKQTVYKNALGLYRGYTGHEMLPGFELINMGGRMYDPVVARFLSCDNFVQEPTNSQNFNRYSYCFNNPLKYKDPDGQFAWILVGAAIGAACNITYQAIEGNLNSFGDVLVAGAIGAGAGAITAATYGTASGAIAGTFVGAATGVFSTAAQGVANNMYFGTPLPTFSQFVWSAAIGGVCGGVGGYFSAKAAGKNPLTGKANTVPAVQKTSEPLQGVSVIQEQEVALESQVTIKAPEKQSLSTYMKNNANNPNVISHKNSLPEGWSEMSSHQKSVWGVNEAHKEFEGLGLRNAVKEVSVKVNGPNGSTTYRADLAYIGPDGRTVFVIEVKAGPGTGFTPNQSIAIPQLTNGGNIEVVPYGDNAKKLFGTNLPKAIDNFEFKLIQYK